MWSICVPAERLDARTSPRLTGRARPSSPSQTRTQHSGGFVMHARLIASLLVVPASTHEALASQGLACHGDQP